MTNNFKDALVNKKFYAENANAALLLYSLGQTQAVIELPTDMDDGVFVDDGPAKAQFMICELILDDNVGLTTDASGIELKSGTSGKATVRVYPNILPFNCWDIVQWSNTETVTCNIKKDMGVTTVESNISNPKDLQSLDIGGEYVDFEFTLGTSAILSFVTLVFTGGI